MKTAPRSGRKVLDRNCIESLDDAFYAASCFAASAPNGTVRIWQHTFIDGSEEYCIRNLDEDPNQYAGLSWIGCYEVKRMED